jgi:hypothetical protein
MDRCFALVVVLVAASALLSEKPDDRTFFAQRVWPILKDDCLKCHGGARTRNGLDVSTRADLLKGGKHGPAVVPGDPEKSLLSRSVRYLGDYHMPPKEKLSGDRIDDLVEWVRRGAPWPSK